MNKKALLIGYIIGSLLYIIIITNNNMQLKQTSDYYIGAYNTMREANKRLNSTLEEISSQYQYYVDMTCTIEEGEE